MKPERFCQLAEIYGSNLRRWPATEQVEAQALLDGNSPAAIRALHLATQLDDLLDGHLVPAADPALACRPAPKSRHSLAPCMQIGYLA